MDLGISKRVAMVAAASKGLGRACALSLAAEGCRVSICARNREELERARGEIEGLSTTGSEALAVVADVASEDDLDRWHRETVERFGPVDILVTNTGGPPVARFLNLTDGQWRAGVDSTLMNVVRLSRLVIPGMQGKRWGRIVHLTSFVAKQPVDDLTISSTLRAGICALTRTMANQVGPDNVTVNAVLMGHYLTDRQRQIAGVRVAERGITLEQYFAEAAALIPLRRMGDPKELGDTVAFLASERASYVTGVSLLVDGGLCRGSQ
ncbi:MAG: SDR family oxidoreductase [Candidatus Riflebacteria bacterium]|nr:SDR family oxidoreductase [Candidatus Riflebacteria bacterium]